MVPSTACYVTCILYATIFHVQAQPKYLGFDLWPLPDRRGLSYVVSNHDSALLFEIKNFNGGWLEIILATEEVVS